MSSRPPARPPAPDADIAPPASSRQAIALSAAAALNTHADRLASLPSLVGFDGFIDDILDPVRTRRSMAPDDYEPIASITEFADRARAAAGLSTNIELVRRESRFGGNGPLLASGLASFGLPTTFIGCIGHAAPTPTAPTPAPIHPLFQPFADRCRRTFALGPPGHTDALEFADGKIMFNQTAAVQRADWPTLLASVGLEALRTLMADAAVIGIVNWSLCGGVESIWNALIRDILPSLPPHPAAPTRRIHIDLSDPAKRSDTDISRALDILARLNTLTPVTLGLNLAEARRIASVLGVTSEALATPSPPPTDTLAAHLPTLARDILIASRLDTIVIHPREGAAAATRPAPDAPPNSAWFQGPLTRAPRLSTGAGDHFNAGFAAAQALALDLPACLAIATCTSGAYVRDAASPTPARIAQLLTALPAPEST